MGRIAAGAGETWLGTREPSNVRSLALSVSLVKTPRKKIVRETGKTHERNIMHNISLNISSTFNQLAKKYQIFADLSGRRLQGPEVHLCSL